MFSEFQHECLRRMAATFRDRGLDPAQTQAQIEADFGGFCTLFHIRRAVRAAFCAGPDLNRS